MRHEDNSDITYPAEYNICMQKCFAAHPIAFGLILLCACKQSSTSKATPPHQLDGYIELEQWGGAKIYDHWTLRLTTDGHAYWHGDKCVAALGEASVNIDGKQIAPIIQTAIDHGFFQLDDDYPKVVLDAGTWIISISADGRTKRVKGRGKPEWVDQIGSQIEGIVSPEFWRLGNPPSRDNRKNCH